MLLEPKGCRVPRPASTPESEIERMVYPASRATAKISVAIDILLHISPFINVVF